MILVDDIGEPVQGSISRDGACANEMVCNI